MSKKQGDKPVSVSNNEIIDFCQKLTLADWERMATKTQTIKDIVAHLVGWQRECVFELEKTWNSGVQPWFMLTDDYDEFNAKIRGEFHSSKPSELLEKFRYWDSALNKTIDQIGEGKLRNKPGLEWVLDEGEDGHFLNHFLQIKKAVEGQS